MRIFCTILFILNVLFVSAMDFSGSKNDSMDVAVRMHDQAIFYDSLQVKASKHRVTRWLYDFMIAPAKDSTNKESQSYEYYKTFSNKLIGRIKVQPLDVFGPDFEDTTKNTNVWLEKVANQLHSKSNLNVIRKNLWIKEGQPFFADVVMDNERYLRSLPYLKDVKFIIQSAVDTNLVDIVILTKDVFSFGISGSVESINVGEFGIYDKNILGIGHEIGVKLFGHANIQPHLGIEAYYSINNLKGNFIDLTAGYANNYARESFFVTFERGFLRPQSVFAYGLTALRSFRTDRINMFDRVSTPFSLNLSFLDGWYGRRLRLGINPNDNRFQMTWATRVRHVSFYDRPSPDGDGNQYFANSTMYLGGLSFSKRSYVRGYKVYSYGITEDIPKGYLHELVFGYDHNETGDRWYSHLFLSTGNLFRNKPFYLYTSIGIGSFWRPSGVEQGMADFKINFISPLFVVWDHQVRQFIKLHYTGGINRFEIENLFLREEIGIRGFDSRVEKGKQRLTLTVENVFFQNKPILGFQTSFFSFLDLGIVGPANQSIFTQDYFGGIGAGLRLRNENLVFKTLQLRFTFYPNHPSDVNAMGFVLNEVARTRFYTFQPRGPEPFRFE